MSSLVKTLLLASVALAPALISGCSRPAASGAEAPTATLSAAASRSESGLSASSGKTVGLRSPVSVKSEPLVQTTAPAPTAAALSDDDGDPPTGPGTQQVATAPQASGRNALGAAELVESPAEVAVLPAPGGLRAALSPAPEGTAPDLSNLPEAARIDLLSRPPVTPPFPASTLLPPTRPSADPEASGRCRSAVGAAQASVLRFLALPPSVAEQTAWVEDTLRVTELALALCQGQSAGEGAATYWRATAFLLHGQYARAAVNFRRVADDGGTYAAYGYSRVLADLLEACARSDRAALDAWRIGGLHEAAGRGARAADFYHSATSTACRPLRDRAKLRLSFLKS